MIMTSRLGSKLVHKNGTQKPMNLNNISVYMHKNASKEA